MEAMRNSWTDERLDDGFDRVTADVRSARGEVQSVKHDLQSHRAEMHDEFKAVRTEMQAEFKAVRTEMQAEFRAVRTEMQAEFKAVRTEMRTEFKAVRTEMREEFRSFRTEVREGFGQMDARLAGLQRTFMQLCGGIIAALIGVIATQL